MTYKLGCKGLLKPELDLIQTIFRTSSKLAQRWQLVERGECHALIVEESEQEYTPFTLQDAAQLITIRRRGQAADSPTFYRPFNADEFIDSLIAVENSTQPPSTIPAGTDRNTGASPDVTYRLTRWPSATLLAIHREYALLAAYLSKGPKTLGQLHALSGKPEAFCLEFLERLQINDCVVKADHTPPPESVNSARSNMDNRKGVIGFLKSRFGL